MNSVNWKDRFFGTIRSINWKKGFFRLAFILSILCFIAGIVQVLHDSFDSSYSVLYPFDSPIMFLFAVSGFPWLMYFAIRWPVYTIFRFIIRGFISRNGKSYLT